MLRVSITNFDLDPINFTVIIITIQIQFMLLHPKCIFYLFRKSFGATLVRRVRKAGSDFMNKVPRVSIQANEELQSQ